MGFAPWTMPDGLFGRVAAKVLGDERAARLDVQVTKSIMEALGWDATVIPERYRDHVIREYRSRVPPLLRTGTQSYLRVH